MVAELATVHIRAQLQSHPVGESMEAIATSLCSLRREQVVANVGDTGRSSASATCGCLAAHADCNEMLRHRKSSECRQTQWLIHCPIKISGSWSRALRRVKRSFSAAGYWPRQLPIKPYRSVSSTMQH